MKGAISLAESTFDVSTLLNVSSGGADPQSQTQRREIDIAIYPGDTLQVERFFTELENTITKSLQGLSHFYDAFARLAAIEDRSCRLKIVRAALLHAAKAWWTTEPVEKLLYLAPSINDFGEDVGHAKDSACHQ